MGLSSIFSSLFQRRAGRSRTRRPRHRFAGERLESRAMLAAGQAVFNPTSAAQEWAIPAGVTSASIALVGGIGGLDNTEYTDNMPAAQVAGTLSWPAGTTVLDVWVGGNGGNATGKDSPGAGGFNGGASGGTGSLSSSAGGGGGGATDIRIGGSLPGMRVMVAGGSGGAGGSIVDGNFLLGGDGGTGGVWTAGNGAPGNGDNAGSGGAGGQAANGQATAGGSAGDLTGDGGGGGGAGGYLGGYGGASGTAGLFETAGAGGGGGGGSSYADPSLVTNATAALAYNIFTASATISWVDIVTESIAPLTTGTPTQQQLVATYPDNSFTPTWQVTGGVLPAGLALSQAGELTGTPTSTGAYSFTVTVTAQPSAIASSTFTYTGSITSELPAAPTNVQGQGGYESVVISWTGPTNTGGGPITGYAVRYTTEGGTWTIATADTGSTATIYTVTGLTSSLGYRFEVAAINAVGTGGWSASSSVYVPEIDPATPTDVAGTSAYQAVDLSWLAPPSTQVPIVNYEASSSVDGGSTWSTPVSTGSTKTIFSFTGLTQAVPTIFRVRAVGPSGHGGWSAPSAPVTPETLPTAPTQVSGTPGDQQVTLTWTAPSDLGGSTLVGYKIEYQMGQSPAWQVQTANTGSTATTYVASGLTNGTSYSFRVTAITQAGAGPPSIPTGGIVPFTTPSAPSAVTAVAGNAAATLSWQPPADDEGRVVSGYRIEAIGPGGTVVIAADTGSTATTYVVTGLVNGAAYRFQVAAINAAGAGPLSATLNPIVPSAPSTVVATQVRGDLVIAVSGGATAYLRTLAGSIQVAANRAFTSAQQFDPATVTSVIVSGNTGAGGFVFTTGVLAADMEMSGIGSIAFETTALATGAVRAALTTGPLVVSSAIRGLAGVRLDADLRLASDVDIDGGTGGVTITGAVDGQSRGSQSLTVTALGATVFRKAVGATVPLKSIETRATRPLVLSSDASKSRTIPLHYLPYTTPDGLVEDKYGIEVAVGDNPARMYEFDTGGTGFWAGYNPEWWQGVVPSANAAYMANKYTSGNFFDGLATSAVLTLGGGSQKVSTGGAVQITAIMAGGNTNTNATFDFSTASMPPIEGHFFGDFGASFGIATPTGGPPAQVTNPLLQLPGNLSSGFVVQLGPLGTSPRVVVGITDDLRAQFQTAIPLTAIDGQLYPNPNGVAFQRQVYDQFAFSGQYSLSRDGKQASIGTIPTLIDSGAPTMTVHYPVPSPPAPGTPFVDNGMVTNGTTFTGVFPQLMGVPPFEWSFTAGNEASVNAIAFTPEGSAASPANSVNTGLNFYNGYDVMFDVATGYLRLRPNGGLSSVTAQSVTTLGGQRYGQNATLAGAYSTGDDEFFVAGATTLADAVTVAAGTAAVTFSGTVDSSGGAAQPLTVQSAGETRFVRPVGGIRPLASLATDAGGSTAAVSVTTVGAQRFNDAATLDGIYTTSDALFAIDGDATLAGVVTVQTTGPNGGGTGGAIRFGGRIDSAPNTAFPLVLDAGDDSITVTGIVGASRPLGGITIEAAQAAAFAAAVHLDGSGFGAAADGLDVGDQVTVRMPSGGSIRRFTGSGVVFDKESQHSHLRGFEITDNVYDGIQIAAKSAGGTIHYKGTKIEGNAIYGNGGFGIEVAGPVRGLAISDNTIGREGVKNPWDYVSGGPNTHGIVLAPGGYSGTVIAGNTIRFSRRSGIMMPGGATGVRISSNVLERNTAHGIEAATGDFTGTTITGNTIRLNGGDGISLGAGIGQGVTSGGNPQAGYTAAVGHYFLSYANDPDFYNPSVPPPDPQIAMQVGTKQLMVNLDTGSRGLYFDALQLDPSIALDGPKGHVFLNSSDRLYFGQWSNQKVTFTQSSFQGPSGPPDPTRTAQANVPVLVVSALGASTTPAPGSTVASTTFGTTIASGSITITDGTRTRTVGIVPNVTGGGPKGIVTIPGGWWANYADNMTDATTSKLAPVANFGIGFDRSGQGTAPTTGSSNQLYNAFLNLTEMQGGTMRSGYVISATGVTLGLDGTVSGFASTDLAPTGLPRGSQSAPDWQPATGTVGYQDTSSGTGQIVIDMGIPSGILTLPGKKPSSKFGGTMTVDLLNSGGAVRYGIDTSNASNLLNPTAVAFFNPLPGNYTENLPPQSSQFFNTGRKVFAAFDYLYDAAAGLLGLKVGSTPAAQNAFKGNGQFTAAHFANPNAPAGVTNLTIGEASSRLGNTISANGGNGVTVNGSGSLGNAILSNSIFANGGLGIDLANGGNAEQAAPVLAPAVRLVGEKTVALTGTLATTSGYSGTYRLQFFSTPFADSTGAGAIEGRTLLGEIPAASAGDFTATFARGAVGLGDLITVTATPDTAPHNTSEFSSAARIMTLVVDTTADAGTGSLRSGMTLANANPGTETIEFGIAATPRTIAVRSPLPAITGGMLIDGSTQPVTVSGAALRTAANGFTVAASAPLTEIRSLTIAGFARGSGIWSAAANALFDGNTLRRNFNGISLAGGPGTLVSGNTITASRNWGIYATGGLAGARIESNTITSTVLIGVYLQNATGLAVGRAGAGNVITGGTARGLYSTGIYVAGIATGSRVQANTVSGNGSGVMLVGARGVLVGGPTDADRNTISRNRGYGLFATGNSTGSIVQRNVISGNGRNVLTRRGK